MTKFFIFSTQIGVLFVAIALMSTMSSSSAAASSDDLSVRDMSSDNNEDDVQEQRREYDFNKLRRFLLTSNVEQRTAKREQQELHKRELVRQYLESISDPNPNRFEEVKKRFKTYCNSYEDLMNSNWAACG